MRAARGREPPWLRILLLAATGALEGNLLANGPGLVHYDAVRLGPHGIYVSIPLLCMLALAALGVAAALARWLNHLFSTLLAATVCWSLASTSQHPFWHTDPGLVWEPLPASGGTVLAHALALALAAAAAILDGLAQHREAARRSGQPPQAVRAESARLAGGAFLLLGAAAAAGALLATALDGAVPSLRGLVAGPPAFAVLVASALLAAAGLAFAVRPSAKLAGEGGQD